MRIRRPWVEDHCFDVSFDSVTSKIFSIRTASISEKETVFGVGDFVWRFPCTKEFWCVFRFNEVLWLAIGEDIVPADGVELELIERRFICEVKVKTRTDVRRYKTLQPWITDPLLILDHLSSDEVDREMSSFPVYLANNLRSSEWQTQQWPVS